MTAVLARGMRLDGFVVTDALPPGKHATVVQARDPAGGYVAVKLATTRVGAELTEREAGVFRAIGADTGPAPRYVADGSVDGLPYRAAGWRWGTDPRVVAAEARQHEGPGAVRDLCRDIARAYASLHAAGAVHGQVHPRHVLVDAGGRVSLLDLSLATMGADVAPPAYLTLRFNALSPPEHSESLLCSEALTLTPAAEQYSIAALLYLLVTGRMYAPLRLDKPNLARDIIDAPPVVFSDHGVAAWPELESVLGRALEQGSRPPFRLGGRAAAPLWRR